MAQDGGYYIIYLMKEDDDGDHNLYAGIWADGNWTGRIQIAHGGWEGNFAVHSGYLYLQPKTKDDIYVQPLDGPFGYEPGIESDANNFLRGGWGGDDMALDGERLYVFSGGDLLEKHLDELDKASDQPLRKYTQGFHGLLQGSFDVHDGIIYRVPRAESDKDVIYTKTLDSDKHEEEITSGGWKGGRIAVAGTKIFLLRNNVLEAYDLDASNRQTITGGPPGDWSKDDGRGNALSRISAVYVPPPPSDAPPSERSDCEPSIHIGPIITSITLCHNNIQDAATYAKIIAELVPDPTIRAALEFTMIVLQAYCTISGHRGVVIHISNFTSGGVVRPNW